MSLNLEQIKDLIPHREPMLLIEQVLEIEPGAYCKAMRQTLGSDFYFQGHFPGNPIMPGIFLIEAMTQTSAITAASTLQEPEKFNFYFGGTQINSFRQPVVPGDQLILESRLQTQRLSLWIFECVINVNNIMVAQAEIKLMIFDPEQGTIGPRKKDN
jgi:3-hydroxyacyl-[acyl-carrier-protein] dehydratase